MGLINLDIISTVVQRSVTGRPVPTGNTIIMQGGADIDNIIDKITADLRDKYLSKTIDDEALGMIDFKPGLKIGGIELKYDEENNAVYIERTDGNPVNFYATGGLSMYGLGNTKVTSIMNVIEANIDPDTLGIVNGKLTVIGGGGSGGEGGITAVTKQMVIEALGFTPYSAENPNGYITAASIPSALKNPYALTFGSKTYDGSAAKSITASDLGAALSSDLAKYLPLSGGTLTASGFGNALCITCQETGSSSVIKFTDSSNLLGYIGIGGTKHALAGHPMVTLNSTDYKLWHAGNDGSGSGLDADLLDGKQPNELNVFSANCLASTKAYNTYTENFNKWQRIAKITLSGQYANGTFSAIFYVGEAMIYKDYGASFKVYLHAYQQNAMGNAPYVKLTWDNSNAYHHIAAIVNYNSSASTIELYAKSDAPYCNMYVKVLEGLNRLNISQTNYTNIPSGTRINPVTEVLAASSAKLTTARTIWGQSFDGTADVTGTALIGNNVANGELLRFNMDRHWSFIQENNGSVSYLCLKANYDDKLFNIRNNNNEIILSCRAKNGGNKVTIGCGLTVEGNILATGGVTMQSQRSLKNVVDERGLSLTELSAIKPTRFTWKDKRDDKLHFGGIADDIERVLPEVIYTTSDGTLTMDYGNAGFAIAASLIKPVIDHETEICLLKIRVKELEEELKRYSA